MELGGGAERRHSRERRRGNQQESRLQRRLPPRLAAPQNDADRRAGREPAPLLDSSEGRVGDPPYLVFIAIGAAMAHPKHECRRGTHECARHKRRIR